MKRTDVNSNLEIITNKLLALQEERENNVFVYVTRDKYLDGHGYVNDLPDIQAIIECQKEILRLDLDSNATGDPISIEALKELGIEDTIVPEKKKPSIILGFPVKYWNDDLKVRINELRSDKLVNDLGHAKWVLESNLSEDDKFENAMGSIAHLLD